MSASESPSAKTQITIESKDGCSELYLQNDAYTVVARGVGCLRASVAPGLYKVRQRVGDTETSHVIDVAAVPDQYFSLGGVLFPSPMPLAGTNTSHEFQQSALNSRVPTANAEGAGQFSLLLRDSRWIYGADNSVAERALMQEASRLRVESFSGTYSKPLLDIAEVRPDAGFVRLWVQLPPRQYVLTQSIDDRTQRCLPLRVLDDWALHLFFNLTRQPGEAASSSLDFDKASIVYGRPGGDLLPTDPNLLLLETARKAFARGRYFVASDIVDRVLNGKFGNPVLGLLGTHLLLDSPKVDAAKAGLAVDNTAALLGESFPDVIALRLRLAERGVANSPRQPPALDGPPLVVASYSALTRMPEKVPAQGLSKVFWFPFTVEATSTWFIWNEAPAVRQSGVLPDEDEATEAGSTFRARGVRGQPSLQHLVQELLSKETLQPWVRHLKRHERETGAAPTGLGPLDRSLLSALASAQASLIPGVIDTEPVAARLVAGLNVPAATARRSASKLTTQLEKWVESNH